ncbi:rhodanese-like domain-containing protein [Betaproteobacteria bacterium SCN1]|jgi:rhodanese-related sulfurtransferase|nr:rhodanese-like domain-containing protein [Betaproteobacteria bacterium SCN1]MBN8760142.1 rhodanese-like domain-containing protein [Thiobacillus sp.]ODU87777.1 MAG: sulfurtransferase [Thiobacillus sp. SCN 65-179]OJW39439.1 MAG: sulfurtransferase [Thiobacillus sp. 65-69]
MLRTRFPLILGAAFLLLAGSGCAREAGPNLSAPDAHARAQAGQLTLIDIRRPDEWKQTRVAQGALEINMVHPQGTAGFVKQVAAEVGGDRNAPIGLICRTGNRTTQMQRALVEAGFTRVYNVKEGMAGSGAGPGWIARGLPTEACKTC